MVHATEQSRCHHLLELALVLFLLGWVLHITAFIDDAFVILNRPSKHRITSLRNGVNFVAFLVLYRVDMSCKNEFGYLVKEMLKEKEEEEKSKEGGAKVSRGGDGMSGTNMYEALCKIVCFFI